MEEATHSEALKIKKKLSRLIPGRGAHSPGLHPPLQPLEKDQYFSFSLASSSKNKGWEAAFGHESLQKDGKKGQTKTGKVSDVIKTSRVQTAS